MPLVLVQELPETFGDKNFWGIILLDENNKVGYGSCDWDGKMDYPHPASRDDGPKFTWLRLHDDNDTLNAFIGEKKIRDDGEIWGKVYWD